MRTPARTAAVRSFKLSYARQRDATLLAEHRKMMWLDIHPEFEGELKATDARTRKWIEEGLSKKRLVGLIVKTPQGEVAGSGCVWLREEQPRPTSMRLVVPYLMSMYTVKKFRRQGVASLVVKKALDWCRERNYDRIVLHASKEGRPVYEALGFEPSTEMRLKLTK